MRCIGGWAGSVPVGAFTCGGVGGACTGCRFSLGSAFWLVLHCKCTVFDLFFIITVALNRCRSSLVPLSTEEEGVFISIYRNILLYKFVASFSAMFAHIIRTYFQNISVYLKKKKRIKDIKDQQHSIKKGFCAGVAFFSSSKSSSYLRFCLDSCGLKSHHKWCIVLIWWMKHDKANVKCISCDEKCCCWPENEGI